MQADPSNYRMSKQKIVRIWIHEVKRVFQDRLVFEEDISKFNEYLLKALPVISDGNVQVSEADIKEMMGDHNIFTSFVSLYKGESDSIYLPVEGF